MRLRTRVLIGSGAVVTSLVAGLAIYGWALPGLSRLSQESMLATRLKLGSQQLDSLVHEYLIEGNPRARQQLDIQLADLAQMSLQAIPLAGNPLREAMASEQARTVRLLDEIERRRLESTNWMSQILGEARLRHLFEQAIISSRELHDLSREWKADVDRRREVLVITAGLGVGGILLGTLALLVAGLAMLLRTVVRPVERLRAGVAAIAKGDYSHRITDAAIRHEVGLLVSDFNGMAEQLQRAEETRLRAAEREREAAIITRVNEGLERFTTHASHDLQAPLRTITCFGELLQRRLGDTLQSPDREHLQRMVEAAVRMSATIDGFLRFARGQARSM